MNCYRNETIRSRNAPMPTPHMHVCVYLFQQTGVVRKDAMCQWLAYKLFHFGPLALDKNRLIKKIKGAKTQ